VANPIDEFRSILNRLSLQFTPHIERQIQLYATASSSSGETDVAYAVHRDARKANSAWKEQLTAEEIGRIRRRVEAVSSSFYSDSEW
jgi:hypothetical protein